MQKLETIIDWSNPIHRDKVLNYLGNLPEEVFWFEIKKYRKNRSREQNAYYWSVVVKMIADELGYETDEMHEILKQKFNSKREEVNVDFFRIDDLDILNFDELQSWVEVVEPEDIKKDEKGNYLLPLAFVKKIPNFETYGEVVQFTESYLVPISTAKTDTYEFSQYIEKIRDWAAMELNILIPSPDENN